MNDLERLCRIMGTFDLATGHAETMSDALDALEEELKDVLGHLRARHEWVGLTDERYEDICGTFYEYGNKNFFHERGFDPVGYGRAVEAELKEKNYG